MVNAKANITPEMLLWLAERMGLQRPLVEQSQCCTVIADGVWQVFNPATDDAQFGRLVVWAAMQGMSIRFEDLCVEVFGDGRNYSDVSYNNTPDSIRAAAVVAICRALGWEGKE